MPEDRKQSLRAPEPTTQDNVTRRSFLRSTVAFARAWRAFAALSLRRCVADCCNKPRFSMSWPCLAALSAERTTCSNSPANLENSASFVPLMRCSFGPSPAPKSSQHLYTVGASCTVASPSDQLSTSWKLFETKTCSGNSTFVPETWRQCVARGLSPKMNL